MVILVSADMDVDGADGTELPTLRLLDSGGVSWTLPVRVDNKSAILLVNPSSLRDLSCNSFNITMLLSLTKDCWEGLTTDWRGGDSPAAPFPTGKRPAAMPTTTMATATMVVTSALFI